MNLSRLSASVSHIPTGINLNIDPSVRIDVQGIIDAVFSQASESDEPVEVSVGRLLKERVSDGGIKKTADFMAGYLLIEILKFAHENNIDLDSVLNIIKTQHEIYQELG